MGVTNPSTYFTSAIHFIKGLLAAFTALSIFTAPFSYAAFLDHTENDGTVYLIYTQPNQILRYDQTTQTILPPIALHGAPTAFAATGDTAFIAYSKVLTALDLKTGEQINITDFANDITHITAKPHYLTITESTQAGATYSILSPTTLKTIKTYRTPQNASAKKRNFPLRLQGNPVKSTDATLTRYNRKLGRIENVAIPNKVDFITLWNTDLFAFSVTASNFTVTAVNVKSFEQAEAITPDKKAYPLELLHIYQTDATHIQHFLDPINATALVWSEQENRFVDKKEFEELPDYLAGLGLEVSITNYEEMNSGNEHFNTTADQTTAKKSLVFIPINSMDGTMQFENNFRLSEPDLNSAELNPQIVEKAKQVSLFNHVSDGRCSVIRIKGIVTQYIPNPWDPDCPNYNKKT